MPIVVRGYTPEGAERVLECNAFEARAVQHEVEVTVTDAAGLSASQTFTIAVADVNEAPSIDGLDASEIAQDAAPGTVVGARTVIYNGANIRGVVPADSIVKLRTTTETVSRS